jgi:hypothetical protein
MQGVYGYTLSGYMLVPLAWVRTPANENGHAGPEKRGVEALPLSPPLLADLLDEGRDERKTWNKRNLTSAEHTE